MRQERITLLKLMVLTVAVWTMVVLALSKPEPPMVLAAQQPATSAPVNHDKVVWLDNYEAALKEAKATGKPIWLEFRCAP